MISTLATQALLLTSLLYLFSSSVSANISNVDSSWLASWNAAVANRPSELKSFAEMVSSDEAGTRLAIKGLVVDPYENPAEGVIVHAYHRDNQGFDFGHNDKELTTWRIQGWAITDRQGRFTFDTIKAAPDHLGREGGHVHFTTISEEYGRQWALKAYFSDDESLTERQKAISQKAGRFGAVREVVPTEGGELINVAIKLKPEPDF
ncbi:dioxygenase family protein [Flavobacterium sp. W21_SRS_FM6]|uniref:dioxygenase family protein n=1 Tax=Flavobacterium sp. W21_SRS_FM6 TaxID=3240268 RepID=UPI003F8E9323